MRQLVGFLFSALFVLQCCADIYLHNPRGSNDRNCETGDRRNANRLFDSQNNAAGGYACPRSRDITKPNQPMFYYAGSQLTIEWTNQHACGSNSEVNCDVIIQYMCEDVSPGIRDGYPSEGDDGTTTIPYDPKNRTESEDHKYGQHETYDFYQNCTIRQRNKGLYIADQKINSNQNSAIYTRQNPGGTRHGFECPEERDYYPYFGYSPWKDIAIMTNNASRCEWYQQQSQNVKSRGQCLDVTTHTQASYNNEHDCTHPDDGKLYHWVTIPSFNLPPPECFTGEWNRINHLGNTPTGYPNRYNWTIPNVNSNTCVLRVRYNISTGDFPQMDGVGKDFVDNANNSEATPLKQDYSYSLGNGKYLTLAVNTNQYGRTFQDRSYIFSIKPKPANVLPNQKIYNLNVRGKRGNIVQVYPAVEYGFVPEILNVNKGDFIHIQWTGSDYNPQRNPNDGEGYPNTGDRSNLIEIPSLNQNVPIPIDQLPSRSMFSDMNTLLRFVYIDQTNCSTMAQLAELAKTTNVEQDPTNCFKLNSAPSPYFNGTLVQMNKRGQFYYMCTRNNNFSNRDQKGTIVVNDDEELPTIGGLSTGWTVVIVVLVICTLFVSIGLAYVWVQQKKKRLETHYTTDLNESLLP